MPKATWIHTETPEAEQWRQLGQFRYPPNVARHFAERGFPPATAATADYVAGSIGQAEAYFDMARTAPIDISPLLLYYGSSSLLAAVATLKKGYPPSITEHGMALDIPLGTKRISDIEVVVRATTSGALRKYSELFGDSRPLAGQSRWKLADLLASLPDLRDDTRMCIPNGFPFVLRLDSVQTEAAAVDRIALGEFSTELPDDVLRRVPLLTSAYLAPQRVAGHLVLYPKLGGTELAVESLNGQRAILVAHDKAGVLYSPGQLILILMCLFALGSVSRYNPILWHPFVRTDSTGERLLVQRFLSLATRWLPNLALSAVRDEWIRFSTQPVAQIQGTEPLTEARVRAIIQDGASSRTERM